MVYCCELSDFEETLWTYPTSKLEYYQKAYALKTSILGRVTSDHLLEQEEAIKKMSKESRKLKRDFNFAQAANLDPEKKVADLTDALKKCQDENKIAEDEKKVTEEALKEFEERPREATKDS
jgi:predicted  nucleic acid-binding Zn-ribbon protein